MNHDVLIDAVARDMTNGDPPTGLRARVLAGLAPAKRPWWPRVVAPAAAMAAIATSLMLLRPANDPLTHVALPARPTVSASAASTITTSLVSDKVKAGTRAVQPRVSAEELAWLARAVPSLPTAPPMAIDPIQPTQLSIAPITVEPLVSEPIALAPLESGSGARNEP